MPVTGTIEQASSDSYYFTDCVSGDIVLRSLANNNWLIGAGSNVPSTLRVGKTTTAVSACNFVVSGKMGVKNVSPFYTLDVSGDINFTGSLYQNGSLFNTSPWLFNSSNAYFVGGFAGVGTSNPAYNLDVAGSVGATTVYADDIAPKSTTLNIGTGAGAKTINIGNTQDTVVLSGTLEYITAADLAVTDKRITINKGGVTSSAGDAGIEIEENSNITGYIKTSGDRQSWVMRAPTSTKDHIFNMNNNDLSIDNTIFVDASSNVGIGDSTPSYKLDVNGVARASTVLVGTSTDTTNRFISALDSSMTVGATKSIVFGKSNSSLNQAELGYTHRGDGASSNLLSLGFYNSNQILNIRSDARVGIGSTAPSSRLHVSATSGSNGATSGSGDYTNAQGNALTVQETAGFPRVVHLSADASNAGVYNYQTGKSAYWGESTDTGTYIFRGRGMSIKTDATTSYALDVGGVINTSDKLYATNNISIGTTNTNEKLTINAGNVALVHGGAYGGNGSADKWISVGDKTQLGAPQAQMSNYGLNVTWDTDGCFMGLRDYGSGRKDAVISFGDNLSSNNLRFQTSSNNEIMVLTAGGQLGVGKTPASNYKVDVNGSLNATSVLVNGAPIQAGYWSTNTSNNYSMSNVAIGKSNGEYTLDVGGDINFTGSLRQGGVAFGGGVGWSNYSSNVFSMSNIGIGTSLPQGKLWVSGDIRGDVIKAGDGGCFRQVVDGAMGIFVTAPYLCQGYTVATDPWGNVYMGGTYTSSNDITLNNLDGSASAYVLPGGPQSTSNDGFLIKVSPSGAVQGCTTIQGTFDDYINSVCCDGSGNVYAVGSYRSTSTVPLKNLDGTASAYSMPTTTQSDAFLIKYSSNGTVQGYTAVQGTSYDYGYAVCCDPSGNVYFGAQYSSSGSVSLKNLDSTTSSYSLSSTTNSDCFVIKLSPSGSVQGCVSIKGTGADAVFGICSDPLGNIYVAGNYTSTTTVPLKNMDGSTSAYSLPVPTNTSFYDAFLVKMSPSGVVMGCSTIKGTGNDSLRNVCCDPSGNIYAIGNYASSNSVVLANLDGTNSAYTLPVSMSNDNVIIKFSASGVVQGCTSITTTTSGNNGLGICSDSFGNIYATGRYQNTSDIVLKNLDGTNSPYALPYSTSSDGFVLKMSPSGTVLGYTTIQGGNSDYGYGVCCDSFGNVYATGIYYHNYGPLPLQNLDGSISGYVLPKTTNGGYLLKYMTQNIPDASINAYETMSNVSATTLQTLAPTQSNATQSWVIGKSLSSNNSAYIQYTNTGTDYSLGNYMGIGLYGKTPSIAINTNDFVGIGTTTPSSKLDVSGNLNTTTLRAGSLKSYQPIVEGCLNTVANTANYIYAITTDASGSVYYGGYNYSSSNTAIKNLDGTTSAYYHPLWTYPCANIVKMSPAGTVQGCTAIQGNMTTKFLSMCCDPSGNIYGCGYYSGTSNALIKNFDGTDSSYYLPGVVSNPDAFLLKMSSSGVVQGLTTVQGSFSSDQGNSVCCDPSGNAYFAGYYTSSNSVSLKNFDGTASAYSIPSTSGYDAFLIKLSASGVVQGCTTVPGTLTEAAQAVCSDPSGNIYLAGYYTSTSGTITLKNLDGSASAYSLPSVATGTSAFVAKISPSGVVLGAVPLPAYGNAYWNGICSDQTGNIYVSGSYSSTLRSCTLYNLDGTASRYTLSANTTNSPFVFKMSASGIVQGYTTIKTNQSSSSSSICVDPQGNMYFTGYYNTTSNIPIPNMDGSTSPYYLPVSQSNDPFMVRISQTGKIEGCATFGGTTTTDQGNCVSSDPSGNIYLGGYYTTSGTTTLKNLDGTSCPFSLPSTASITQGFLIKYKNTADAPINAYPAMSNVSATTLQTLAPTQSNATQSWAIGKSLTNNNSAYLQYTHNGTDFSSNNYLSMGVYGNNPALAIAGTGNIGVGTTTPAYKLDVAGSINASSVLVNGVAVGAGGGGVGWSNNGSNIFSMSNIGIGTSTPAYSLDVGTGTARAASFYLAGADTTYRMEIARPSTQFAMGGLTYGFSIYDNSVLQTQWYAGNGKFGFGPGTSNTSATMNLSSTGTANLRISSSSLTYNADIQVASASNTGVTGSLPGDLVLTASSNVLLGYSTNLVLAANSNGATINKLVCSNVVAPVLTFNSNYGPVFTANNSNILLQASSMVLGSASAGGSNVFAKNTILSAGTVSGNYWGGSPSVYGADTIIRGGNIDLTGNNGTAMCSGYGGNIKHYPGYACVSQNTSGNSRYVESGKHQWYYANTNGTSIDTGYTLAMTLDNTGKLGIGTSNPSYNLDVSGAIYATQNIYAFSDARYKHDLQQIKGSIDKLKALTGYTYNTTDEPTKRYAGLLAQDVEKVLPEAVSVANDKYALAYDSLAGLFVEAFKEIDARLSRIESALL